MFVAASVLTDALQLCLHTTALGLMQCTVFVYMYCFMSMFAYVRRQYCFTDPGGATIDCSIKLK